MGECRVKVLLIIVDGIGDVSLTPSSSSLSFHHDPLSIPSYTPLQLAPTPHMDALTRQPLRHTSAPSPFPPLPLTSFFPPSPPPLPLLMQASASLG